MKKHLKKDIEKLISEHKKRNRRTNLFSGIRKTIEIGSSIASTLLLVREKPRMLDYISIGTTVSNTVIRIHDELAKLNIEDPRSFYDSNRHYTIPYTLEKTIFNLTKNQELLLRNEKVSLHKATIGTYDLFWIESDKNKEAPFCKSEEFDDIIKTIGKLLWEHNGSDNVMLDKSGTLIPSDESLDFKVTETNAMQQLEKRLLKFKNKGIPRSYLLEGPPGTGKSSAAMYLIKKLKMKSLRTALTSIYDQSNWNEQGKAASNLDVLLRALRPDMIIVDDIDRSHMGDQQMLKLFETARKYCKIIMATCNNKNSMIGAMLRVGRFDDHIEIDHLDVEVVEKILDADDKDIAVRLSKWPIAYIQNYKTVKDIMGKEEARKELDDMERRIFEIERKTRSESGWSFNVPEEEETTKRKRIRRKEED